MPERVDPRAMQVFALVALSDNPGLEALEAGFEPALGQRLASPAVPWAAAAPGGLAWDGWDVGPWRVALALIDAPPPASDLADLPRHTWDWPDADEALASCTAHAIVGVRPVADLLDPAVEAPDGLDLALALTRAVAAVLDATDAAVAVIWVGGPLQPAGRFRSLADELPPPGEDPSGYLPLRLWIDPQLTRAEGSASAATRGLRRLGLPEIEVPSWRGDAEELLQTLGDLIALMLEEGDVLAEGEQLLDSTDGLPSLRAERREDGAGPTWRLLD